MVPNIIRMILLKSKINSEIYAQNYAINVNNIISIDLKKDNKTGKIVICTVDKYVFTIYKKPDIIYDLYMKILSFCTNGSNSNTVIPDNNILEIESD
jgi:hypothetical protein